MARWLFTLAILGEGNNFVDDDEKRFNLSNMEDYIDFQMLQWKENIQSPFGHLHLQVIAIVG